MCHSLFTWKGKKYFCLCKADGWGARPSSKVSKCSHLRKCSPSYWKALLTLKLGDKVDTLSEVKILFLKFISVETYLWREKICFIVLQGLSRHFIWTLGDDFSLSFHCSQWFSYTFILWFRVTISSLSTFARNISKVEKYRKGLFWGTVMLSLRPRMEIGGFCWPSTPVQYRDVQLPKRQSYLHPPVEFSD